MKKNQTGQPRRLAIGSVLMRAPNGQKRSGISKSGRAFAGAAVITSGMHQ
jgi:hypothetical protein